MRTSHELLDAARARGWTDYRIAKEAGVSRQYISKIRSGATPLTEQVAEVLARALDEPAIRIYAEATAARAKRPGVVEFWERVARGAAAALTIGFIGLFGAPMQPAHALTGAGYTADRLYIIRTWRRRRRR